MKKRSLTLDVTRRDGRATIELILCKDVSIVAGIQTVIFRRFSDFGK